VIKQYAELTIDRKSYLELERETTVLVKPQPEGLCLDGWDI